MSNYLFMNAWIPGAFAKFRSVTINLSVSLPSVCLSAWNNSVPTRRIFMKNDISGALENLTRKVKFD
jgi:hypothetical protein